MRRQRLELYELPDYIPRKNKSNDYGFDPHEQEHETYTGMGADINVHDQWACESRARCRIARASISASPTRRSSPIGVCCARRSTKAGEGGKPLMVLDAAVGGENHRALPRSTASARPTTGRAIGNTDADAAPQGGELGQRAVRLDKAVRSSMSPRKSSSGKTSSSLSFRRPPRPVDARAATRGARRRAAIKQHKLELIRFSFADQHGVLRGKTLVASEAAKRCAPASP